MRPRFPFTYRHDLRSALTSRAIFAVAILTVLAGVSALVSVDSTTNSFPISGSAVFYYANGAYQVTGWAYDAAGAPVSGVVAEFSEVNTSSLNTSAGPYTVSTNGQGEFTLTVSVANEAWTGLRLDSAHLESSRAVKVFWGGIFSIDGLFNLGFVPPGSVSGSNNLVAVGTDFYSAHAQVMAFTEGPNGTAPVGFHVDTCSTAYPILFPPQYNCTGLPTRELGLVTGYWAHFPLPSYPGNASEVFVQVVNESGGIVESLTLGPTATVESSSTIVNNAPGGSILTAFATEESFFLPLIALLTAYWTYARPRLSGTVEPVLARPVTRRGVFVVRYASVAIVLVVVAVVEVVILDAGVNGILGEPLPIGYLAPLIGGLLVAALGSAGILFLIAHSVRTPGAALGSGIGVLIPGFFWSSLVLGLLIVNNPSFNSSVATLFLIRSQLFLPPQFPGITTSLLIGLSPFGIPLGPSPGGVNYTVATVVGVAWIVIPVVLAYWRAVTRD